MFHQSTVLAAPGLSELHTNFRYSGVPSSQIHLVAGNRTNRSDDAAVCMASDIVLGVTSGLFSSVLSEHLVELCLHVPAQSTSHRFVAFAITQIVENLPELVMLGVTASHLHSSSSSDTDISNIVEVVVGPRCSKTLVELELEGIRCSSTDLGCSSLTIVSLSDMEQDSYLCTLATECAVSLW